MSTIFIQSQYFRGFSQLFLVIFLVNSHLLYLYLFIIILRLKNILSLIKQQYILLNKHLSYKIKIIKITKKNYKTLKIRLKNLKKI